MHLHSIDPFMQQNDNVKFYIKEVFSRQRRYAYYAMYRSSQVAGYVEHYGTSHKSSDANILKNSISIQYDQCFDVENVKYQHWRKKNQHTGKSAQIRTFLSHCTFLAVVPHVIIIINLYDFTWISLGAHWMIFVVQLFNRSVIGTRQGQTRRYITHIITNITCLWFCSYQMQEKIRRK